MKLKEIIDVIKKEQFSVLIIVSLFILPFLFLKWIHFFPSSWQLYIIGVIVVVWIIALIRLRKESLVYRRKIILQNYLEKRTRASFIHLSEEWDAKDEFTEKNINELLFQYPDVFKRVKVERNKEYKKGVGLVKDSTEVKDEMEDKEEKKVGVGFGVMLLKDGKVLLGRRHEDPAKASSLLNGAGTWTMPGGKLEFGESFEEGARREASEETGIRLNKVDVICINNDMVETAHFVTIGLFSDDFEGEPKVMEPDEITEWRWFNLDNLPTPIYFPSAKILENYKKNQFYTQNST